MKISRITEENEQAFAAFFPEYAQSPGHNLIRLGVVDENETASGALCAQLIRQSAEILSVYVTPEKRRQGYASLLLRVLEDLLKKHSYNAMACNFIEEEDSALFLHAFGFRLLSGRTRYFFTLEEVLRSPLYQKLIMGKELRSATRVPNLNPEERIIFERIVKGNRYDPEWSSAYFRNGKCMSLLLANRIVTDVDIMWLETSGEDSLSILHPLRTLLEMTIKEFGKKPDVMFRMTFENEKMFGNIASLLGGTRHLRKDGKYLIAVKLIT